MLILVLKYKFLGDFYPYIYIISYSKDIITLQRISSYST